MRAIAAFIAALVGAWGLSVAVATPSRAAEAASQTTITDPTGDSFHPDPRGDITSGSINYWRDAITLTVNVAQWTDPATDPAWNDPENSTVQAIWSLDTIGDNISRFGASISPDGHGGLVGAVAEQGNRMTRVCNADAVAANPGYRLSFPAACIGSPSTVSFALYFRYGPNDNASEDVAPDAVHYSARVSPSSEAHSSGGFVTDDWGGLQPYRTGGTTPPSVAVPGPYWPGKDVIRGNAATFGGGYVVDDWGGIHSYKTGSPGTMFPTHGGPYWPGKDVARGIALMPDGTGGYVLDDWGGLHPFGINFGLAPPVPEGGPYWPGQDVARGVAILPDGSGGYVVDDWGALHPFVIPGEGHVDPFGPADGPYWFGQDIARGVVANAEGNGGYVVDDWGGIHPFSVPGTVGPVPAPSAGPYWPGKDVARGISVVPQDPPPTPPPG